MNIFDCWVWEKEIPTKEINKINKEITKLKSVDKDYKASTTKIAKVKVIKFKSIEEYLQPYLDKILTVNEFNFGYNLYPVSYGTCNYNIYEKGGEYDWHVDESLNNFHDIKLTAIFNLSENKYKGGDFKFFKNVEMPVENFNKPGDILLFKSHMNHKVMPVVQGVRKTLTLFLKGPRFV